jgi:hypothetical protein
MQIIEKRIDKIKEYEGNPRSNNDAVEPVMRSIETFGFKVPIVIDKHNVIVCGHTRYKAAIKLGLETVPCIIADDLTDNEIKAFRLVDNKCGEYSTWIDDLLKAEIVSVTINLNHWDFPNLSDVPDIPPVSVDVKGMNYKEKYGIVIDCKDEAEQKKAFEYVTAADYKARIVSI